MRRAEERVYAHSYVCSKLNWTPIGKLEHRCIMYLSLIFFTRVNEDLRISNCNKILRIHKEVKSARGPNVDTPDRRQVQEAPSTPALTGPL